MEFSEKELNLIKEARRAVKFFRILACLPFFILVLIIIAGIAGYFDYKTLIAPSIIYKTLIVPSSILICILSLFPGFGRGPKYSDLVNLLESKQPKRKNELETFMDVIKEANKT